MAAIKNQWQIQGVLLAHALQQDSVPSFLHMFPPKSTHIGGRCPPNRWVPPPQMGNPGSAAKNYVRYQQIVWESDGSVCLINL